MIHKRDSMLSPAPLEESLLLSPRGGAASLWRCRRLREEERVERRVKGKELGDAPVVIGAAPAELVHLFACLPAETGEPELIAGREAEATTGFLEAARGAAEGAPAAAVAIEQRIFVG